MAKPRNSNLNLTSIVSKIISFLFITWVVATVVRIFGTTVASNKVTGALTWTTHHDLLPNPYASATLGIDIPLPHDSQECSATQWRRTKPNGQQIQQYLCYRSMQKPDTKNFEKAVQDAADALLKKDQNKFNQIKDAWPAQNLKFTRKKLHDDAVKLANKKGANIRSTMPELPKGYKAKDETEKVLLGPHRTDVLKNQHDQQNVHLDNVDNNAELLNHVQTRAMR